MMLWRVLVGGRHKAKLSRTWGVFYLIYSCGLLLDWCEMFTAESATQIVVFLLFVFEHLGPAAVPKFISYDDMCHLCELFHCICTHICHMLFAL